MDDEKHSSHIDEALAHAMVPPTQSEAPPAPRRAAPEPQAPAESAIAQDEFIEDVIESMPDADEDPRAVYAGETISRMERLWPLVWLGMLTVVCVIGIYNAVRMLP